MLVAYNCDAEIVGECGSQTRHNLDQAPASHTMAYIIHVQTHSHVDTGSFMTQIPMRHEIIKQSIKFSQLC